MSSTSGSFGVVGSPIAHSLSPVLHRAAYRALDLHGPEYSSFDVPAGGLRDFLTEGPGRSLNGLSVTMPGKTEAFALAADHDPASLRLRIANTLVRRDGVLRAENHDVHGIRASFADHGVEAVHRAGVIGSGATALSAADALAEMGAEEVFLTARSPGKLDPIIDHLRGRGVTSVVIPWESSRDVLETEAVVSALAADGAAVIAESWRRDGIPEHPGALLDVLYHPWPSLLTTLTAERGGETVSGLEMLVHQAVRQVESMLQVTDVPREAMMEAALAELDRRSQIS